MRRSALAVLAALVLTLAGGGVAVASPPAPPQVNDLTVRWGMYVWDDGITRCTLIADAALDPGFTKGAPVYAHASTHVLWVGEGGGTWQEFNYWNVKLSRGDTRVHTYTSFEGDSGYYVADWVRVDLTSPKGLISSMQVDTTNTCMNG